ncbi:TonB family protein [Bacteroidales bacterium OttesenSCG-928-I21]|nr:TonB family protein [Bacteroidales bacterium OttesenSCG-928-I21]
MSKIDLTSRKWNDIIFEGRNKKYGGYDMRQTSDKRHIIALIIVFALALTVFYLPSLIGTIVPKEKEEVKMTEVTALSDLTEAEKVPEEVKPIVDVPPPPPLKSSIKFTAPVIKKREEIAEEDEMKDQKDLIQAKETISTHDIVGTDEEHGKDIAELNEIMQENLDAPPGQPAFTIVEQMPQFPGGEGELLKYISKSLRYPAVSQENGIQGKVTVRFVVSKTGEVTNVEILRSSVDGPCDKEAIRVIQSMPKWIPGKQNGVNVNVYYVVPITFRLQS